MVSEPLLKRLDDAPGMASLKQELISRTVSVSRVLDCLTPAVHEIFKNNVKNDQFWTFASAINIDLLKGLMK
jgi:hypothetical protein